MTRKLTTEEIRILAEAERLMDAGKAPFVLYAGGRMLVRPVVMEELGLETGQTISDTIARAIAEAHLAAAKADLALAGAN